MFGISGGEFIVILVIAAFVLGPKNVAQAVVGFRKVVEKARVWSARVRKDTTVDLASLGFNSSDVEKLRNLKLSDYDPREMVRQAVQEEMKEWAKATQGASTSAHAGMGAAAAAFEAPAPRSSAHGDQNQPAAPAPAAPAPAASAQPGYLTPVQEPIYSATQAARSATVRGGEAQSDGPLDLHTILNQPDLGGSR